MKKAIELNLAQIAVTESACEKTNTEIPVMFK